MLCTAMRCAAHLATYWRHAESHVTGLEVDVAPAAARPGEVGLAARRHIGKVPESSGGGGGGSDSSGSAGIPIDVVVAQLRCERTSVLCILYFQCTFFRQVVVAMGAGIGKSVKYRSEMYTVSVPVLRRILSDYKPLLVVTGLVADEAASALSSLKIALTHQKTVMSLFLRPPSIISWTLSSLV
jgi:hypothetical protein